jgi:diguanylate cyclase (GGDEF)-like protein/PAS domain S-box-containing protein
MSTFVSHVAGKFWRSVRMGELNSKMTRDQSSELRARQIEAIHSLSPMLMAGNLINAAVIDGMFWTTNHKAFMAAWSLWLAAWTIYWGRDWRLAKKQNDRDRASARGVRRVTLSALLLGATWAAPLFAMFGDVSEAQRVVLASCAAGMISGGAMALATVWQAALAFSLAIEVPLIVSLLSLGDSVYGGLALLSVSFCAVIARVARERNRGFVDAFVANLRLRDQGQVISLLLREFEQNSSDWLFEVDADGRLARVSARLAQMLGRSVEEIEGMRIAELLGFKRMSKREGDDGAVALGRAFRRRQPFQDIVLRMRVQGVERWWSLTGKPMFDLDGDFLGYRGVGSDVTDAKRAESAIERMANFDELTGLPNRHLFHARLDRALKKVRAGGGAFAVLSLDLDRFKAINDTLGRHFGDRLLIAAARRIVGELASSDVVARIGADEFVILQGDPAKSGGAGDLAERLVEAVGAPYEIDGQRLLVGASVGVAVAPTQGDHADDLMRNSDLALYRAKADGKGRHRFFTPEMDLVARSRRLLEVDLREALENGELDVHFQPLIEISTGQISACEALVRWNDKSRGFVSPVDFIPIAEETGLIVRIGEFVLRRACREAADWGGELRIAVNLSVVQFRAGDLASRVAAILEETGLDPRRLELEITESILIDEKDQVLQTLRRLRALGVRISLDDFGTGYSSLAYLSSFPFDKIKIDRSFVRDVASKPNSAAIIRAITGLAATMGICTTAEGVENIEELNWLREQGCGEVQGFLFSAPVPARELRVLLGMTHGARAVPCAPMFAAA